MILLMLDTLGAVLLTQTPDGGNKKGINCDLIEWKMRAFSGYFMMIQLLLFFSFCSIFKGNDYATFFSVDDDDENDD